MLKVKQGSCKY